MGHDYGYILSFSDRAARMADGLTDALMLHERYPLIIVAF